MTATDPEASRPAASASSSPPATARLEAPVRPSQRIVTIDVLRGFAIFGILLVNMELFNQALVNAAIGLNPPATPLDQLGRWFIAFFGEGKFYTTFSFLFGLGMAIQLGRAEARGAHFGRFWVRRMLVLLLFGLIHAYLFWPGDILLMYSVLGICLLLWRHARPRTLAIWVVVLLVLPLLLNGLALGLLEMAKASGAEVEVARQLDTQVAGFKEMARTADTIYADGDYVAVTVQRARDMGFIFGTWPFFALNVLAAMLMGLHAGRRRIFDDIPGHLPLIRRAWRWGLVLGLVGNTMYVYFGEQGSRAVPTTATLLSLVGQAFGAPALAVFFMASLTLLVQRADWRRRLTPLSYVGRMALTNYLLQTLICTTLFYGYGFGLYGRIGIAGGIALTVAIYVAEVIFSAWWLRRFRFGPMEWLWRTLTYGQRQPIRLAAAIGDTAT